MSPETRGENLRVLLGQEPVRYVPLDVDLSKIAGMTRSQVEGVLGMSESKLEDVVVYRVIDRDRASIIGRILGVEPVGEYVRIWFDGPGGTVSMIMVE